MLLKPLNWMNRSRSSSPAASQNLSASPQTTNTSGSEAPLGPSIILPSSISPLSSPAIYSQLSPNLFNQALSKTNNTTQEWLEKRGLNPNSSDTTHIQDQTKELINLMESTRLLEQSDEPLKVEIANRKIVLREYIADAIAFVTMAGDAAIVFAPPQASAPWAVAKAIMKVPVKTLEQKAALCGTVEWFTRITRRGQIYESLYTTETTDEAAVSNLHNALLELYTAAVELLAKFDTMARSGAFKEILAVVLSPNYAKDLVSSLLEKEEKVDREIRSCNASRSAISSEEMKIQIKALQKQLAQLSSPLPRIDESVSKLLEKVNKRELEELMNFISSEMFGKSHATVTDTRIEKTGDWLLGSRDFRAWQDIPSSSSVFLLKGAGGTGKTYLTSKVIDHIRKLLEISPHDEGFAYFYCNRSGPSMQQPLVVLQSFVRQLSGKAFDDSGKIQSSLVQKCSKAKREGRELSYKDCEELILESLNLYSKTTVVLDALDESDIETYNLAKYLIQMMEKSERPVKIYISSRPDREYLEEVFKDKFLITVDASNQHDDIQKYLEDKLYSTEKFRGRKQEIQDEIKDIFNTKGCGMFRWVYLQVKSLEKCTSEDAIHNWTRKLPRDLTGAYNQLWENIQERDESDIALAERAIMWVLCAIEPLKSEVLLEAIQYTINGPTVVRKEKQSQQQILSLCQDFLTIDEERGVWMLPHASVAEYFESKGWTGWKCDAFASKVCLGFLENFRPEMIDHRTFAYYIENNWHEHVGRYEEWLGLRSGEGADPDLEAALKRFLGSPDESSDSYRKWVQEYIFDHLRPIDAALFAMCKYGFYYTLRDWWLEGKITEEMAIQKNRHGENSLALAAYGRGSCMPICRHLIDLIDVMHPEADRHARALRNAVDDEKFDIVKLLVMEANADVNFPFSRGECTAQLAAQYYPEMLQWMLDHGRIDLEKENDSGYECGNVLISAAYCGNIDSVRLLLGAGANVNAAVKSGKYGSALVAAVADLYMHSEGKVETVKLLLESGADPNLPLRGGKYGSALEAFALRDQDRIPLWHIFVEAGADPTAVLDRGEHGSALAAAAFDGQKDFLKVMIDHVGADKAINVLRQSRHPNKRNFRDLRHIDRCEDTAVYLANEVGASKDVLLCVGLWDVEPVPAKSGGFEI